MDKVDLEQVIGRSPIGLAIVAPDGKWLEVNPALCRMVGYAREDLLASDFQTITHPDDLEVDLALVRRVLARELEGYELEKRYIHRDGRTVWVSLHVSLVWNEDGTPKHFISQLVDLTERKRVEEQFRQAQKMEAIGQLASGVAHDFNNILAAIMIQVDEAASGPYVPEATLAALSEISEAAQTASNLTRQLMQIARKQPMRPRAMDLNDCVSTLIKLLGRVLPTSIDVRVVSYPAPVVTRADANMMDQVLMNLVVNARDAMPAGGTLAIATAQRTLDGDEARDLDLPPGPYACLRVSDTGIGIPPDALGRIFEPFFTTKEAGRGTGLGLATVFNIVKQHRGAIAVSSIVGTGTIFEVLLPAASRVEASARPPPPRPAPQGRGEMILLVEDNAHLRSMLNSMLERNGYAVLEARNGRDAMELWEEHGGEIDVVLTDLVMPDGLDGHALADLLQERTPELPIILMSGHAVELGNSQRRSFLSKPCAPHEMLEAIRKSLDAG